LKILLEILIEAWTVTGAMAPYLLLGFLVAGYFVRHHIPALIEKHMQGRSFWAVVKASLLGVPMPLCSCGVIPVFASFKHHGAGRGPLASFLISHASNGRRQHIGHVGTFWVPFSPPTAW